MRQSINLVNSSTKTLRELWLDITDQHSFELRVQHAFLMPGHFTRAGSSALQCLWNVVRRSN